MALRLDQDTENFARGNPIYPGGSPNPSGNTSIRPARKYIPNAPGPWNPQKPNVVDPPPLGNPVLDAPVQAGFERGRNDLQALAQQYMAQKEAQFSRIDSDVATSQSRLGRGRELALDSLRQSLANRGILRSGINAEEQGKVQEGFNNSVADLQAQMQRMKDQANASFAGQMGGIQQQLAAIAAQEAAAKAARGIEDSRQHSEITARNDQLKEDYQTQVDNAPPPPAWTQPTGGQVSRPVNNWVDPTAPPPGFVPNQRFPTQPNYSQYADAVKASGHNYGSTVNEADIFAALKALGHNPGSTINPGDLAVLKAGGKK